jgi:U3 small nucleolar RNA-associated protein 22
MAPRFQVKSTHYLVTLASLLPASLGPTSLSYVYLPTSQAYALEVRHAKDAAQNGERIGLANARHAVLRIQIVWPADAFPSSKLSPNSNLARPDDAAKTFPATPIRASAMHSSSLSLLTAHLKYHHTLANSFPAYAPAVRLMHSWAARRGHELGIEFWAWCVARTIGTGGVPGGNGPDAPWAVWRRAVEWLAGVNWVEGVVFRTMGEKKVSFSCIAESFPA